MTTFSYPYRRDAKTGLTTATTDPIEVFRYDLAGPTPRIILITDLNGKRSDVPRLSYVVLPQR